MRNKNDFTNRSSILGGKGSGRKPGSGGKKPNNTLCQAQNPANVDPDTNKRAIAFAVDMYRLPEIDLADVDAVEERFFLYLDMCAQNGVRPLVTGLANAYGISRYDLTRIGQGDGNCLATKLTPKSRASIKKSYLLFEQIWESEISDERGNPAKWIFLAKNNFAYKDQTEQVVTKRTVPALEGTPEDVAAKYAAMVGGAQADPIALDAADVVVEDVPDGGAGTG